MNEKIKQAAALIKNSRYTVALTGAGISVPSGIPDFRSPNTGLWDKVDPMEVATIQAFTRNPKKVMEFMLPLVNTILNAEPNEAHKALAELEEKNLLKCVITQNIDNLHQKAGSKNVVEVHGNMREAVCLSCAKMISFGAYMENVQAALSSGKFPSCDCGGMMKPNVVFFGEALPHDAISAAQKAAEECDVMLIAGSSLAVYPVASLPFVAYERGAKIIIVNLEATPVDSRACVALHEEVDKVLPEISSMCARQ